MKTLFSLAKKLLAVIVLSTLIPLSASGLVIFGSSTNTSAPFARVTTNAATSLAVPNATLNGTAYNYNSTGTYYFNYGTSTAYGSQSTPAVFVGNTSSTAFSTVLSSLLGGTVYHFQACVTNAAGVACGSDLTFSVGMALQSTTVVNGAPHGLAVSGSYAYVANSGSSTFQTINISVPTAPSITATTTLNSGSTAPERVFVSGSYLYITTFGVSPSLQIYDIATTPGTPIFKSKTSILNGPYGLYVLGNYAYITRNGAAVFVIYDISVPTAPVLKSTTGTGTNPYAVFVSGIYAYVTDTGGTQDFKIYDISVPTAPVLKSTTTSNIASPFSIFVLGSYAYVANSGSPFLLQIWDISVPTAPTLTGSIATAPGLPGVDQTIFVSGTSLVGTNIGQNGLSIYDVSVPSIPAFQSRTSVSPETSPYWVVIVGSYAYVTTAGTNGLQIWLLP